MGNIVELLGWTSAAMALAALSNHFLKLAGRTVVKSLARKHPRPVEAYRKFMKFMVRRHRLFGLGAILVMPVHGGFVLLGSALSVTGGIAALALAATASLGAYGFFIGKSTRAGWLPVHRAFAFLLLLAMGAHLLDKAVIGL